MKTSNLVLCTLLFVSFSIYGSLRIQKSSPPRLPDFPELRQTILGMISDNFFTILDVNGDQSLSQKEFLDGLKRLSNQTEISLPAKSVLVKTYKNIDTDNGNSISQDEVARYFESQFSANGKFITNISRIAVIHTFLILTQDSTSFVTEKEFIPAFSKYAANHNIQLPQGDVAAALKAYGLNSNSKVFSNDFFNFISFLFHGNSYPKNQPRNHSKSH
jgi:hypothetical protein